MNPVRKSTTMNYNNKNYIVFKKFELGHSNIGLIF